MGSFRTLGLGRVECCASARAFARGAPDVVVSGGRHSGAAGAVIAALWIGLAWNVATQKHHVCLQIGWIYLLGPAVALAFVGIAAASAAIFHAARRKNPPQPGG